MEHRWGQRLAVDIPVRITSHPFAVRHGRLVNVSVSGAFLKVESDARVLSRVFVTIELPHRAKHEAPTIAAFVARKISDCIGIEWCEFAPPQVNRLLQTLTVRRYVRFRKPDPPEAVAVSRMWPPLLKHG